MTFRLPVAADVLAVAGQADARLLLEQRCVRGGHDARARQMASRAMSVLGPALRAEVAGDAECLPTWCWTSTPGNCA